ncbi:PulJ/GspJ family protein [Benzoatithermus flavus]|uniref:Prepilin-type N-terminal cleavage/methylation domain-containing protein n=1 Tax=Benzoatithermus flavus TaxID=3108223 RepID=A0ABU8XQ50_9PROT
MVAPRCAERRHPVGAAGFTLVELLVSMVVLSLIAITMMAGFRFVFRAFDHTDTRREALEELTLGFNVLRGELERAEPLMHKVDNKDVVLFEGGPDRVRFANVAPPFLAGLPYFAYEYAVVTDGNGHRLELRRAPLDPARPDLAVVENSEPRVIVRLTRDLHFTYFGRLKEREAPQWHEEWPRMPQLPQAVRLAADEKPGWPELVVPLMIRVPWYCGTQDAPSTAGCSLSPKEKGPGGTGGEAAGDGTGGTTSSGFGSRSSGTGGSSFGSSGSSFGSGSSSFGSGGSPRFGSGGGS